MRRIALLALCSLPLVSCHDGDGEPAVDTEALATLSMKCAACHDKEYQDWLSSDHARAWRKLDKEAERRPFNLDDAPATTNTLKGKDGRTQLLFCGMNEQRLEVYDKTDGQEGASYRVVAAIGRRPFVQYLVQGERGAIQATSAAWDVERGGWFDVFADDPRLQQEGASQRRKGDWGHWLGRGMNWNAQCAWCHMTGFEKHYDAETDSYASTWMEPGVTCVQCHSLADEKTLPSGRPVRRNKNRKVTPMEIRDSCASCHARREELRPGFREGDLFDDYFRLELPLVEGIFWPNGMQRDETYTETGMRLSPMGKAGVTCGDCHDSHTARLKAPQEDNSLCLRCHGAGAKVNEATAPIIRMAEHTPCPQGSKGWRCVECHMPESLYMARDLRRDHSFNSPDPQLSEELGIPNACITCHADKDNAWAAAAVEKTYGKELKMAKYRPRTRAVAAAMKGQGSTEDLLAAYRAETNPTWQATLLELLARQEPTAAIVEEACRAASSETPLLRAAAARILGADAPQLLNDPVRLVRYAAAWAQLENLLVQETPHRALVELEETLRHQADQPPGAMQLATLADARARVARSRGDAAAAATHDAEAEKQYGRAVSFDPNSAAARMDFAVYLARQGRPVDALGQMLACTAANPENAEAQYRLGLILNELGQGMPALRALEKAAKLDPQHERARSAVEEMRQAMGSDAE